MWKEEKVGERQPEAGVRQPHRQECTVQVQARTAQEGGISA